MADEASGTRCLCASSLPVRGGSSVMAVGRRPGCAGRHQGRGSHPHTRHTRLWPNYLELGRFDMPGTRPGQRAGWLTSRQAGWPRHRLDRRPRSQPSAQARHRLLNVIITTGLDAMYRTRICAGLTDITVIAVPRKVSSGKCSATLRASYRRVIFAKSAHMVPYSTFAATVLPREGPFWLAIETPGSDHKPALRQGTRRPGSRAVGDSPSPASEVQERREKGAPPAGGESGGRIHGPALGGVGRPMFYRKAYPLSWCTYTTDGDAKRYPLSTN